jgi:hypothetical protein
MTPEQWTRPQAPPLVSPVRMTMTFHFNIKLNRWTITISGVIGFLLIVGVFSLPSFLAGSLDRERAQQEIRHYLKWQAGNQLMSEMRAAGLRSPNAEQARRWQERSKYIDQLEFVSVEIRRFLFVPPFTSNRLFLVKVVSRDTGQQERTRYFSLSSRNRFFSVFLVTEQSRLMWALSV